jgi:2-dehydro-3-deoxyphosphogluconate aldolase/(4S)-4-hydroxy-2-oxoglutarate aldolase
MVVGAGTVRTPRQADDAIAHGARFVVSPGTSPRLLEHLAALPVPVLPGVATVGEILTAVEHGLTELKLFPAGPVGGPAFLAAVAGPVPEVRFCPTGGVSPDNLTDYLALGNVPAVGGSWLTPRSAVAAEDWAQITALAVDALSRSRR